MWFIKNRLAAGGTFHQSHSYQIADELSIYYRFSFRESKIR